MFLPANSLPVDRLLDTQQRLLIDFDLFSLADLVNYYSHRSRFLSNTRLHSIPTDFAMTNMFRFLAALIFFGLFTASVHAKPPIAEVPEKPGFEKHVRPILKAYCTECHGEEEKPKGGLDLRLAHFIRTGGRGGPSVTPGKPDDSYLIERVVDGDMPPGKVKLSEDEIEVIRRWIAAGAQAERQEPEKLAPGLVFNEDDRNWWAFQPIRQPTPPKIAGIENPIDQFIAAQLQEQGHTFNPEADKVTLIRRLSIDLIGLPPTPEEVAAFVADDSPQAYETLVDRLLSSRHYGERWGRHWLDVAGYADSEGNSTFDPAREDAWKYRDYVIRSLNQDKPYDQFVREQLAGDEMVAQPYRNLTEADIEKLTATGFLRNAPDGTAVRGADEKLERNAVLTNTVKIVSSSFLGLTVGCAECHNHRYDPIPQADFYSLRALFEPAYDPEKWTAPAARRISLYTDADKKLAAELEAEAKKVEAKRAEKLQEYINSTLEKQFEKVPEEDREAARKAKETAAAKLTKEQKDLLAKYPNLNVTSGSLYLYDRKAADELKAMLDEANAIRAKKPKEEFIRALYETPGRVPATKLFHRGDFEQPKQDVPAGALSILNDVLPFSQEQPAGLKTTGRRLAFADWLLAAENPLTTRVFVNRIWLGHFGKGIVPTPGDFGRLGEAPTHPELLDWLASEFRGDMGWSQKALHRLIVTSQTYKQSAIRDAEKDRSDPDNRLYGRFPMRRIESEVVRDAMLAVAGQLNSKPFGPATPVREDEFGQVVPGHPNRDGAGRFVAATPLAEGLAERRSIYIQIRRTLPLNVLDAFDPPSLEPNCEARASTTVATQSLLLMNNQFVLDQAMALAQRLQKEHDKNADAKIERAWLLAFGVKPTEAQLADAKDFLSDQQTIFAKQQSDKPKPADKKGDKTPEPTAEELAWQTFCQAILVSNRFLYLE